MNAISPSRRPASDVPRQCADAARPCGRCHRRTINMSIPPVTNSGFIAQDIAMTKQGLVIFVGSNAQNHLLAALVDQRNQNSFGHIITVKTRSSSCTGTRIASSRSGAEVGVDTDSWEIA